MKRGKGKRFKKRGKSITSSIDMVLLIATLVLFELILDAVAGDYIKQLIHEHVGVIPTIVGLLALVLAVLVRVGRYRILGRKGEDKF